MSISVNIGWAGKDLRLSLSFVVVYIIILLSGYYLGSPIGFPNGIWLGGGISVAYLLLSPHRLWKYYFIVIALTELFLLYNQTLIQWSLAIGAKLLVIWLVARMVQRIIKPAFNPLSLAHFIRLVFVILVGVIPGVLLLAYGINKHVVINDFLNQFQHYLLSMALGIIVIVPMILLWRQRAKLKSHIEYLTNWRRISILVVSFVFTYIIFRFHSQDDNFILESAYILFPFFCWVAYLIHPRYLSVFLFFLIMIMVYNTHNGNGPFTLHARAEVSYAQLYYFVFVFYVFCYTFSLIILDRDNSRTEILNRENLFRGTFNQTAVGIAHVDLSGKLIRVNQKFADVLGYEMDEILAKSFMEVTHENDIDKDYKQFIRLLNYEIDGYSMVKRYYKKNGEIIWGRLWVSTIKNIRGEIDMVIGAIYDITSQKQANDEIIRLNTELEDRVKERTNELEKTTNELRYSEQQLQKSQLRLNILFETMTQGVIYQDAKGSVISINPAAEKMIGMSISQFNGLSSMNDKLSIIHENGHDFQLNEIPSMVAIQTQKPVYKKIMGVYNKELDVYRWLRVNAYPYIENDTRSSYVYSILEDITYQKNYEIVLKESEEKFRKQYKNLPIPTATFKEINNDLILLDFNKEMENLTREKIIDLIGASYKAVYKENEEVIKNIEYCYEKHKSYSEEVQLRIHPNNNLSYFKNTYAYVPPDLLMIHMEDLSELKEAHKEREMFMDVSLDMLCIAGVDGYFKQLNPIWMETLGWTKEELVSRPYIDFVHPDDLDETLNAADRLEHGENIIKFTNRYQCKDGSYRWLSWRSYIDIESKKIFAVARDVQEEKKKEEQLQKYVKTQSELLREVNHRVKNNLASILSMLHIEQEKALKDNQTDYHNLLTDLASRINGLSTVHSMLSANNWEPVKLADLFRQIIQSAFQGMQKEYEPKINIEADNVFVASAHAQHLTLVINELTTNSLKHARKKNQDLIISVKISKNESMVTCLYCDNGPGFPNQFLQGDMSQANIGLDLIVGIVEQNLEGEVNLINDNGAKSEISFPVEYIVEYDKQ
jgi:PAS domain S-box-containing protein